MRKVLLAVFLSLFVVSSAFAAEPIRIGVYLPLTGQVAWGGQLELEGGAAD